MPNWNLDGIFNEHYLELCERAFTPERTAAQCDLIAQLLNVPATGTLLDICCGAGRHAIEFGKRGVSVVGVDSSEHFIRLAKQHETDRVKFFHANAAAIPIPSSGVDGAYCYYTSFGYGSEDEDLAILKEAGRCLKDKSRLLVEINSGSTVRKLDRPTELVTDFPNGRIVEIGEFNKSEGRCYTTRTYELKGRSPATGSYSVRMYTSRELTLLFEKAGYVDVECYSESGKPFTDDCKRLIVVGSAHK